MFDPNEIPPNQMPAADYIPSSFVVLPMPITGLQKLLNARVNLRITSKLATSVRSQAD